MSLPRYSVALYEGRIMITPVSGLPATEEEVAWVKDIITTSLRSRNFVNNNTKPLRTDDFGEIQGIKFGIDPIILTLAAEKKRRNLPTRDLAVVIGVHPSMVSNYSRGKARPPMNTLRAWAYVLGHDIMAIPRALAKRVQEMIDEWVEAGRPEPYVLVSEGAPRAIETGSTESAAA